MPSCADQACCYRRNDIAANSLCTIHRLRLVIIGLSGRMSQPAKATNLLGADVLKYLWSIFPRPHDILLDSDSIV